jgi:Domain of unknown function (DUF305)
VSIAFDRVVSVTKRAPMMVVAVSVLAAVGLLIASSGEPRSLAEYITSICAAPFRAAPSEEAPYLAESVSAMTKMMIDMGIHPSGDVDSDFVSMMTPHHYGAIEMARAELRYGHNEQLRRMAQEIIVTQLQEIAAMRLALGQSQPLLKAGPKQPSSAGGVDSNSDRPAHLVEEP